MGERAGHSGKALQRLPAQILVRQYQKMDWPLTPLPPPSLSLQLSLNLSHALSLMLQISCTVEDVPDLKTHQIAPSYKG